MSIQLMRNGGSVQESEWTGVIDVRGQRLAVDVRGARPSLLLVNGVGGGRSMWDRLRAALPAELGTVAFDAPGCGGSPPAGRPLTIADHAVLAGGVARALGLSRVDVLGFSFGGMIAQQLAIDSPELVRRLVLVSTGVGVGSWPGSSLALTLLAWPHLLASRGTAETLGRHVFGGEQLTAQLWSHRRRALPSNVHGPSYAGQLLAGASWSSLPWLASLQQPTLLVAGDDDPLVPLANATMMARMVRRSELHRVQGGGHLLVVDRAAEVAAEVGRFLR